MGEKRIFNSGLCFARPLGNVSFVDRRHLSELERALGLRDNHDAHLAVQRGTQGSATPPDSPKSPGLGSFRCLDTFEKWVQRFLFVDTFSEPILFS